MCLFGLLAMLLGGSGVDAQMVETRRHLRRFPDAGETREHLASLLRAGGFEKVETLAGFGVRVVYDTGKPGRVVAYWVPIDAQSVKSAAVGRLEIQRAAHTRGHDLLAAALLGGALTVRGDQALSGTHLFLFQPAELAGDGEAGLPRLIAEGALDNPKPDAVIGLGFTNELPVGVTGWRADAVAPRADRFRLKISPAINELPGGDPLLAGAQMVLAAQALAGRGDLGEAISLRFDRFRTGRPRADEPLHAELGGWLRAFDADAGDRAPQLLDRVFAGVAAAHRVAYHFENETLRPAARNHPATTAQATAALEGDGFRLAEIAPAREANRFAYLAERAPGVFLALGACPEDEACPAPGDAAFSPSDEIMSVAAALIHSLAKALGRDEGAP